ncbi:MAG: hypothetical protein ACRC62_12820 [Microcoleus sp.]
MKSSTKHLTGKSTRATMSVVDESVNCLAGTGSVEEALKQSRRTTYMAVT